jgi:hypothetical protein
VFGSDSLVSVDALARLTRRLLLRICRGLGLRPENSADKLVALEFRARAALVRLRLARKKILVINGSLGGEMGFFAHFCAILGLLEHSEKTGKDSAGVRVNFEDRGLYYDPAYGANSWEYHFQAIDMGRESMAIERTLDFDQLRWCALRGERMQPARAFELINRYVQVKAHIRQKVDTFVRAHFDGFHVIGVHYRGTDKWTEAPRVPYEEVCAAVRAAIGTVGMDDFRLFAASDEQGFVDYVAGAFSGRVISWETRRSVDGNPIHYGMENVYKEGADVVIDCLLLSRCHQLIRTSSDLSLCSTYFNPGIPVVLLSQEFVA